MEESTAFDLEKKVLNDKLYDFENILNIKSIPKNQRLQLDIINYDHAMCISGALVKNGKILQFKVDNSFGDAGEFNGHLIMTNSFLENDVITVILNKKYLNQSK